MTGILNALIAGVSGAVKDAYFNLVSLLLPGNGTNGAQNNTFLDSSTNNFTITRNGNTTQGTFSPFSQTGWGNYFNGTANGSLRADSSTDTNLSGDFTIQAWIYPTANGQSSNSEIISRGAATTLNGWHFGLVASTTQLYFGVNYASSGNTSTSTQSSTNLSLNQWTHVAVTRSGNTCRIYINGAVDTTNTGFTGTPTVSGTEYVYIGRGSYDSTNRQFTGYINNASIIKGTALSTFNLTQPLATGASGQSLLTCTANRFIDTNTATTAKTLTAGSGASVVAFSPFNPTAKWSAATYGGSGYFDGNLDYLSVPSNTALQLANSTVFTIEAFIYWTGTTGSQQGIISKRGSSATQEWGVVINSTGKLVFTNTTTDYTGGTTLNSNQWNHIAVTSDGTNIAVYLNGSRDSTPASATGIVSSTNDVLIGYQTTSANPYTGYISNLRLVKGTQLYSGTTYTVPTAPLTAITNTSLLLNFTNAGIYDATSKNDLETVGDAQISTTQSKWGGSSMSFDGTGDYLITDNSDNILGFGTGDWTIEFWLRLNSTGTQVIFDGRRSSASNVAPLVYYSSGLKYYTVGGDRISGGTLSTGVWYYIAIVKSSGSTRMYIDGSQTGSTYTDGNSYVQESQRPVIGAEGVSVGANPLNGYIQDFRVTKGYARTVTTAPTAPFPKQ